VLHETVLCSRDFGEDGSRKVLWHSSIRGGNILRVVKDILLLIRLRQMRSKRHHLLLLLLLLVMLLLVLVLLLLLLVVGSHEGVIDLLIVWISMPCKRGR
jgi:hypothetical protein